MLSNGAESKSVAKRNELEVIGKDEETGDFTVRHRQTRAMINACFKTLSVL
jgi:hypothetical protein